MNSSTGRATIEAVVRCIVSNKSYMLRFAMAGTSVASFLIPAIHLMAMKPCRKATGL